MSLETTNWKTKQRNHENAKGFENEREIIKYMLFQS